MERTFALPGSQYSTAVQKRTNRTGGNTVKGGVYMIDMAQAASESTTLALGLDGLVAVGTALIAAQNHAVVAAQVAADNTALDVYEGDGVLVDLLVNGNSVNIAKGDMLVPVNAQAYMVKATAGDVIYAKALEASTADGAVIKAILYSKGFLSHT